MLPIVIVDDVEADLLLAERVLRQCKILNPIELIRSGNGCLAYFEGKDGHENRKLPCLLLIDLIMPTPGVEVLKYLRDRGLTETSVIVMLSGLQDLKAIHKGYQLGARTFLVKPINGEDVVQMLSSLKGVTVKKGVEGYTIILQTEDSAPAPATSAGGDTEIISRSSLSVESRAVPLRRLVGNSFFGS
jgi:CheY-like chemotaxis protein